MMATAEEFRQSLQGKKDVEIIDAAVLLFYEKESLQAQLNEYRNASSEMATQYQQMKAELESMRRENKLLREQNQHLTGVQTLQTNELFGRSTEKAEDVLGQVLNEELPTGNPLNEDEPGTTEGGKGTKRESRERIKGLIQLFDNLDSDPPKPPRKRMDLSRLPVQTIFEYDIDELNRKYGEGNWRFAFWTEERTVEVVRQTTYVKSVFKPIVSVGLDHQLVRTAFKETLIPKSVASPSLLAQLMLDWCRMYLPLYRQEFDSDRFGFPLSRQVMSGWIRYAAETYLYSVYEYLCQELKEYRYQHCDETYYTVVLDDRRAGAKSFIWVHRSGALCSEPAIVVYCYEKTRAADHLRDFYDDLMEEIFLTCDAYGAYPAFAGETNGLIKLTGCMMHCRRRFVEALLTLKLTGFTDDQIRTLPEVQAILLIREIYIAENALKGLSADERYEGRQQHVLPKVDAFFAFIRNMDLSDPMMSEKLRDAIQYALNHESCLRCFLDDGCIPIDNGACERSVRPIAQYRRNSLFSFTTRGAQVMVTLFSLIETAKGNHADPYYYLKYLLEQMPSHIYDNNRGYLPKLMPWSQEYLKYEANEKLNLVKTQAPPGNAKPKTPTKGKRVPGSA